MSEDQAEAIRYLRKRIQDLLEANNRYQQQYRDEKARNQELELQGRSFERVISIPTNETEAEMMEKAGYAWLLQHAPHRLVGRVVKHLKRGTHYNVVGDAEAQISKPGIGCIEGCRMAKEGDVITVYSGQDGKLWWRFQDEFNDGRFEPVNQEKEA